MKNPRINDKAIDYLTAFYLALFIWYLTGYFQVPFVSAHVSNFALSGLLFITLLVLMGFVASVIRRRRGLKAFGRQPLADVPVGASLAVALAVIGMNVLAEVGGINDLHVSNGAGISQINITDIWDALAGSCAVIVGFVIFIRHH